MPDDIQPLKASEIEAESSASATVASRVWRELVNQMIASRGPEDRVRWGGGVVLLGAGCSITADIPNAHGVVDIALLHLAKQYRLPEREGTASGQALYDALKAKGVDFSAAYGPELYHPLFEGPLADRRAQQEVIRAAIAQGGEKLNWAHLRLGHLVAEQFFHSVLTTNFDQLALQALIRCGVLPAVADGLEALTRLSPDPPWPQLVHLHGSRHSYELRNSRADVDSLAGNPVSRTMLPGFLSQARFLLVAGYSASDNGLRMLLSQVMDAMPSLPVFWALHKATPEPRVAELHFRHPGSIRLLPNQDADALFDGLAQAAGLGDPPWAENPIGMLRQEAARIASPEKLEAAGRVIARHHAELDSLAAHLEDHRRTETEAERRKRELDGLLLAGDFENAEALLEKANGSARAEEWMRLAEAAAESVLDHYRLVAAKTVETALRAALESEVATGQLASEPLWRVGDALMLVGRLDAAALAFRRLEVEVRALGGEGERALSVSLERLGDIALDQDDRENAAQHHKESLGIARHLAERSGTPEAERDLSVSLIKLGDIARNQGDRENAVKHYDESLGIARRLAERLGTPQAERDLSVSLDRLGDIARDQGDRENAAKHYEESLGIRRRLAERLDTPEAERDLSASLDRLGDIARDQGDRESAAKHYEESLGIRRRLAERLGTPLSWIELALAVGRMAVLVVDSSLKAELLAEAQTALMKGEGGTPPARLAAIRDWLATLANPS